ncbi:MAG TPA: RbsD/FucU family protein [Verrucomicrobiae bacterium]|nr:RbsD/FucU family protein [Verrucomicrobiae bacterium]
MILGRILHPDILSALGKAGHGSCVLIADGNYPFSTHSPASATKVFLNLRRGLVKVTDVLEVLRDTVPIEQATLMATYDGQPATIHREFSKLLSQDVPTRTLPRAEFYSAVNQPTTTLVIATGEEQRFANILITIGVVKSDKP